MRLEIEIDTWEMYEPFVTARDTTTHIDTVTAVLPDGELVGRGEALGDTLAECRVEMLEQPLPAGGDDALEGYRYPVSLCADESCQSTAELEAAASRYTMINIKLDKSGGLTEALKMIDWCSGRGIELMVGAKYCRRTLQFIAGPWSMRR